MQVPRRSKHSGGEKQKKMTVSLISDLNEIWNLAIILIGSVTQNVHNIKIWISLENNSALIQTRKYIVASNQNLFQLRPESDLSVIYKNNEGMKELHLSK